MGCAARWVRSQDGCGREDADGDPSAIRAAAAVGWETYASQDQPWAGEVGCIKRKLRLSLIWMECHGVVDGKSRERVTATRNSYCRRNAVSSTPCQD